MILDSASVQEIFARYSKSRCIPVERIKDYVGTGTPVLMAERFGSGLIVTTPVLINTWHNERWGLSYSNLRPDLTREYDSHLPHGMIGYYGVRWWILHYKGKSC